MDSDTHVQHVYAVCVSTYVRIRTYACMYLLTYQHARFSIMCRYTILEMCECTFGTYVPAAVVHYARFCCLTCIDQLDYYLVCSQDCNNSYSMVSTYVHMRPP